MFAIVTAVMEREEWGLGLYINNLHSTKLFERCPTKYSMIWSGHRYNRRGYITYLL